ncbi:DUF262 domain-containing protein [Kingella kingae]|uniref:DUF262 domain-containing protein n=2 Tax=Kingella kingae TaxID=504 RepID=UPI0002585A83|nr:DUF262 domain-containing protein [Kingella kingae]EIC12946.1 hypothetical protein KKB_08591 [Kingella kingae PYKK081]MBD3613709.1 DUF262 domain-containing protein [Kingella kingae]MBD3631952.1 DUF262 domain-containing protein [Kingella kingae]MBD3659340.1 DUF262 domain-containing protein [Kingella kingae]MDK4569397.1 DUF262 domain-containing protein [Kingella kingae]
MKASEQKITTFLNTAKVQFIIPVYQRNYDWKIEQCAKLLNDILTIGQDKKQESHFIGSIVYIHNNMYTSSQIQEWVVIDGQQRLTTIMLIYFVLYHLKRKQDEIESEDINDNILRNKYSKDNYKLKLKPTDNNIAAMEYLYRGDVNEDWAIYSRFVENFRYFQSQITEENADVVLLGLDKLMFVEVSLERGKDNPQRIFESLNSTGLALSEADLIRNYILMDLEAEQQNQFFKDYWDLIEQSAKDEINNESRVSDFVRDYLTKKNKKIPTKSKVYESFKATFPKIEEKDLADLKIFAKYYGKLLNPTREQDAEIRQQLQYIKRLEINTAYPFLLSIYHDYSQNIIDKQQFVKVLELVQSFVVRRFIVGLPTNALNKVFMSLYDSKAIIEPTNYLAIFEKNLLNRINSQRFPANEEIASALESAAVYSFASKNRDYLLERLENFNNNEYVNIKNNPEITIEHIFPRNPDETWQQDLDTKEFEFMQQKLDTLANLTLTGYNSNLFNHGFLKKRDLPEKGYAASRLWLNSSLRLLNRWGKTEWENRLEILTQRFFDIWQFPNIENEQTVLPVEVNICDLNITADIKMISAQFLDTKLDIHHLTDLYVMVIQILFQKDSEYFFTTDLAENLHITPISHRNNLADTVSLSHDYQMRVEGDDLLKLSYLKKVLGIFNLEDELWISILDK